MSPSRTSRRIVVGVSPGDDCDAALEFAGVRARQRGWAIHLVVVLHPLLEGLGATEVAIVDDDVRRMDTGFLLDCERRLSTWTDGVVPVSTELVHGNVVRSLCDVGVDAELIVLQHHRMARAFHLPMLSVVNGVASRARVPVVAVPDIWHESVEPAQFVLAAVEDARSVEVARRALEEGRRLGASVQLVRVWSYADDFEVPLTVRPEEQQNEHVRDLIAPGFDAVVEEFSDVPCEVRALHGQSGYVLVGCSRSVRMIVIGRHEPAYRFGSHLGPVTRTVVSHARCPVMIVDTNS